MKRNCPVCSSDDKTVIHTIPFSDGTHQDVAVCRVCGMGYASDSPPANYDEDSKYAADGALGSGESEAERERMDETVRLINAPLDSSILDIGCARGGMMEAFKRAGYRDVRGIDPSYDCVAACLNKGLDATSETLETPATRKYDLVVLSHVLEHVWDVPRALKGIAARMKPGGIVYVEVPDACNYAKFPGCPFLDFNREHINHFSWLCLASAMKKNGFTTERSGARILNHMPVQYPAIWGVFHRAGAKDLWLGNSLEYYIASSQSQMEAINAKLLPQIQGREIAIWGFGEFLQQLLLTDALKQAKVVQVIDRDPRKWGKRLGEVVVEGPQALRPGLPVLVASIFNRESIVAGIDASEVITV